MVAIYIWNSRCTTMLSVPCQPTRPHKACVSMHFIQRLQCLTHLPPTAWLLLLPITWFAKRGLGSRKMSGAEIIWADTTRCRQMDHIYTHIHPIERIHLALYAPLASFLTPGTPLHTLIRPFAVSSAKGSAPSTAPPL